MKMKMETDKARSETCQYCGGLIAIRNPTGNCDHLYWPDMLTYEAKRANGYQLVTKQVWERAPHKAKGPAVETGPSTA